MTLYIREKNGRKRIAEQAVCKTCGGTYLRRQVAPVNRKKTEHCSPQCFSASRKKTSSCTCRQCGKSFWRIPSKILATRHGLSFCSRKCKDKAQSLGGNCPEIRPEHYKNGNGESSYAARAFAALPNRCCGCGERKKYLLTVHHIDGDTKNGDIANLEIVCWNCHAVRHLVNLNGSWIYKASALTDRLFLKTL